jgi:hypothetical protein
MQPNTTNIPETKELHGVGTLKSLHTYLRLLENASELKRKMPTSSSQRSVKEGLWEISKLVEIDNAAFKDPQNIAAAIGSQRFVMIWGEPSVTDHVARIFDSSKVLLTVLIDPGHFQTATPAQSGSNPGAIPRQTMAKPLSTSWAQSKTELPGASGRLNADHESAIESLKPLLAGNTTLTCRLFRVLFEHMLGFASSPDDQQGSATFVNELVGSKEHGRSFLATALFILGAEIDREHLMSFMLEQGLFGMQIFEHLLQNRNYCDAYFTFRRLEKAFMASPAEEEKQLKDRLDKLSAQFGGKPYGAKLFEAEDPDKTKVDAYLAAADLIEAMAFTPWSMSLSNAISLGSSNLIRSTRILAGHFERFAHGDKTKEHANQEIGDHLLAFARQFSADSKAG